MKKPMLMPPKGADKKTMDPAMIKKMAAKMAAKKKSAKK